MLFAIKLLYIYVVFLTCTALPLFTGHNIATLNVGAFDAGGSVDLDDLTGTKLQIVFVYVLV